MNNKDRYIEVLIKEVEMAFGRSVYSPSDFEALCDDIERRVRQRVSMSTIKRLWGYVATEYEPRATTLSILAQYAGYRDWTTFCEVADACLLPDSGFTTDNLLRCGDLKVGSVVEFEWNPDRKCRLEALGGGRFRVVASENASLHAGATLRASLIAEGHPFYALDVEMMGARKGLYVCGKKAGIHNLRWSE